MAKFNIISQFLKDISLFSNSDVESNFILFLLNLYKKICGIFFLLQVEYLCKRCYYTIDCLYTGVLYIWERLA